MRIGIYSIISKARLSEYSYYTPNDLALGTIVWLPLRTRSVMGVLIRWYNEDIPLDYKVKPITKKIKVIEKEYFNWLLIVGKTFKIPIGNILNSYKKWYLEDDSSYQVINKSVLKLNDQILWRQDQLLILKKLKETNDRKLFIAPTGFGKTLLLFNLAAERLKIGISTLFLIPEIHSANVYYQRFLSSYSGNFTIWHSNLTPKQKTNSWSKLSSPVIVFGTRSALFLPLKHLGLIILDEAHDVSYFQKEWPYYDLRILLIESQLSQNIIFSTATPNNLLIYCSRKRKLKLIKALSFDSLNFDIQLSKDLITKASLINVWRSLRRGKTPLIFLNHRGFSNRILNLKTWEYLRCNCQRYLFYHKNILEWKCHACSRSYQKESFGLKSSEFTFPGVGIEKLYNKLKVYFKGYQLRWVSSDLPQSLIKQTFQRMQEEPMVVIMTQILIKGYHFKNIGKLIYIDTEYAQNQSQEQKLINLLQFAGRNSDKIVTIETFQPRQSFLRQRGNYLYDLISLIKGVHSPRIILTWRNPKDMHSIMDSIRNFGKNLHTIRGKESSRVLYLKVFLSLEHIHLIELMDDRSFILSFEGA